MAEHPVERAGVADGVGSAADNMIFRGVHHLVLNTDDIKTTIDFMPACSECP